MAVNAPTRILSEGSTTKVNVYRVTGITAADTIQMSADFAKVTTAYLIVTTNNALTAAPAISANTLLTPAGALSLDDGYLIVWGASS
jgi:hypothetical protein